LRTTPKISITLEGNTWQDILREMGIIEASVRGSRIEDLPDEGIVAPDEREGQDGPKKPVCAYCGSELGHAADIGPYGQLFCSTCCVDAYTELIRNDALTRLGDVLEDYQLGPEERAEIMERVRQ
jgi:hypothetical protein